MATADSPGTEGRLPHTTTSRPRPPAAEAATDTIGPAECRRETRQVEQRHAEPDIPSRHGHRPLERAGVRARAWRPKGHRPRSEPPRRPRYSAIPTSNFMPISQRRLAGRWNRNGYVPWIDSPSVCRKPNAIAIATEIQQNQPREEPSSTNGTCFSVVRRSPEEYSRGSTTAADEIDRTPPGPTARCPASPAIPSSPSL